MFVTKHTDESENFEGRIRAAAAQEGKGDFCAEAAVCCYRFFSGSTVLEFKVENLKRQNESLWNKAQEEGGAGGSYRGRCVGYFHSDAQLVPP